MSSRNWSVKFLPYTDKDIDGVVRGFGVGLGGT